ncbi:MAG: hypothetical protein ACI8R4_001410 [Paracoccaceae bacterium]|jgi:hypothetical protein
MMDNTQAHIGSQAGDISPAQPRLMCVATHHKAGTIWIKRVIMSLAAAIGVPWIGIWSERYLNRVPGIGRAFLCNWAGSFPTALWNSVETAFVHVIRDPRDVLLSGCAYHQIAPPKGEKFLHIPRADLDGQTYQQHLNALSVPKDRLLFEMANKHAETVAEMRAWPYGDPRSTELRYEDLMADTKCHAIRHAFGALGLRGGEIDSGVQAFWDNSLFGGLADQSAQTGRLRDHVQSGGRLRRWEQELPRSVGQAYADRFGDDLIALGYEKDNSWVGRLAA